MIPIAADHAPHIINGEFLPGFVADVLPARNFLEHEKADFVARIKKMPGLRVVRSADDISFELVAEDLRIAALYSSRHGLPDPGKGLMAVEPAQLDDLAVKCETVIGKLGFAQSKAA